MPSVSSPSDKPFSAQSNPSACCGKASGAASAASGSGFVGVDCLDDGFGGVSGFEWQSWPWRSELTVVSKLPPGNNLAKAVSKARKRSSTLVKCLEGTQGLQLNLRTIVREYSLSRKRAPRYLWAIVALFIQLSALYTSRPLFRALQSNQQP